MTTGMHDARKFGKASARIGNVLDHLKAAYNVEAAVLERQRFRVCNEVLHSDIGV